MKQSETAATEEPSAGTVSPPIDLAELYRLTSGPAPERACQDCGNYYTLSHCDEPTSLCHPCAQNFITEHVPGLLVAAHERDEYKRLLVAAINAVQPGGRAVVSERCSLEFLRHGPDEVRLARGAIERDRDANRDGMVRLQKRIDQLEAEKAAVQP